jgi:hypothetical protein
MYIKGKISKLTHRTGLNDLLSVRCCDLFVVIVYFFLVHGVRNFLFQNSQMLLQIITVAFLCKYHDCRGQHDVPLPFN